MTENRQQLHQRILEKRSFLCVGLDPDPQKVPAHLREQPDGLYTFLQAIIEATLPFAVAYKPNLAFFEALGATGWILLERILQVLPENVFKIADAKRGDIGNTGRMYAVAFFEKLNFDAITLSPYMGKDSVAPFLEYPGKWAIVLAATSNQGHENFQALELADGKRLYEEVVSQSMRWAESDQLMYVFGATHPDTIKKVRKLAPDHFLLVPGIGAQGGDLATVFHAGRNTSVGLLVNVSRSILYASSGEDFAEAAGSQAATLQRQMHHLLQNDG